MIAKGGVRQSYLRFIARRNVQACLLTKCLCHVFCSPAVIEHSSICVPKPSLGYSKLYVMEESTTLYCISDTIKVGRDTDYVNSVSQQMCSCLDELSD